MWEAVHHVVCDAFTYSARRVIADVLCVPRRTIRVDVNGGKRETRNNVIDYYNEQREKLQQSISVFGTRSVRYLSAVETAKRADETAKQFTAMFALIATSKQTDEQKAMIKGYELEAVNARMVVDELKNDILSALVSYGNCIGRAILLDDSHDYDMTNIAAEGVTIDDALTALEKQING